MSSKSEILNKVERNISIRYDMPEIKINGIEYANKEEQFIAISKAVGGDAVILGEGQDLNELIKQIYPKAEKIASNLSEISINTIDPDSIDNPRNLNGVDLAIIKGEIGVCENGSVWIPQNVKQRALYFISEYLVILLNKNSLVNNMHEAYTQIKMSEDGFGIFISGPSKTADIEQALVVGAHGARGVTVILV